MIAAFELFRVCVDRFPLGAHVQQVDEEVVVELAGFLGKHAMLAATAIAAAVGAGAVPNHADKERAVMAIISRPAVLRIGHQRVQVLFQGM